MSTPVKSVKVYRVIGRMKIRDSWQIFRIDLIGTRISEVIDRVYSVLGSRHKLPRQLIKILDVKEIDSSEARDEVKILLMLDKVVKF